MSQLQPVRGTHDLLPDEMRRYRHVVDNWPSPLDPHFTGLGRCLTDAEGNCAPGLTKPVPTPMIHVWITPHECGPFAALEGHGAGHQHQLGGRGPEHRPQPDACRLG